MQKILAHAGLGSRRECEAYILDGRVTVDGKVVRELGTRVDAQQSAIAVDGERIKLERMVYFAVHKPKGYVSTNHDPAGRPRVVDLLPEVPERVYSVGRLDEDSTGLMILTNDGELANRLAHPRFGVEKTYRALVAGSPTSEVVRRLSEGIWLSEGKVRAKRARIVGSQGEATMLELVLAEGKKREIRRMLAKLGHKVMSLTRVAIGPVVLKGLPPGEHRPLSRNEVDLLQKVAAGVAVSPPRFLDPMGEGRPRGRYVDSRPKRSERSRPAREPQDVLEPRPPARGGNKAKRTDSRTSGPRPPGLRAPGPRAVSDGPPGRGPRRGESQAKPLPGKGLPGKPMPGKPVSGKASPGKATPGKALPGKPAMREPSTDRPAPVETSSTSHPRRPAPRREAVASKPRDSSPRRRIIGLPPRVAEEAGLAAPSKPPRKRPAVRRKPLRRTFGIRRPDEDGGADDA